VFGVIDQGKAFVSNYLAVNLVSIGAMPEKQTLFAGRGCPVIFGNSDKQPFMLKLFSDIFNSFYLHLLSLLTIFGSSPNNYTIVASASQGDSAGYLPSPCPAPARAAGEWWQCRKELQQEFGWQGLWYLFKEDCWMRFALAVYNILYFLFGWLAFLKMRGPPAGFRRWRQTACRSAKGEIVEHPVLSWPIIPAKYKRSTHTHESTPHTPQTEIAAYRAELVAIAAEERHDCTLKQAVTFYNQETGKAERVVNPQRPIKEQLKQTGENVFMLRTLTRQIAEQRIDELFALVNGIAADCVWSKEYILSVFDNESEGSVIVFDTRLPEGQNIAAFTLARLYPAVGAPPEARDWYCLDLSAVASAYRGFGLSSMMWEESLREIKAAGHNLEYLYTNYDNVTAERPARHRYKCFGFLERFDPDKTGGSFWPHYRYDANIPLLLLYRQLLRKVRAYTADLDDIRDAWQGACHYFYAQGLKGNSDDKAVMHSLLTQSCGSAWKRQLPWLARAGLRKKSVGS
jgi:GNAT superfamily N-acetyltransferase